MAVNVYAERAEQLYRLVKQRFYVPEADLYREYDPPQEGDQEFSWLWPFSSMISALNALARMPGQEGKYNADLRSTIGILDQFRDDTAPIPAYDSYMRHKGGGTKYYDDNEWLGLDFLEAYHTLGDAWYLEQAKTMFEFAYSGWSPEKGGGIYWRENDLTTKNTCSNGPAALLALKLYQETGESRYIDLAQEILEWLKPLRAPEGYYWDCLLSDGTVDKRTYTYNTGTPLHSYALLYEITGDPSYLAEAQALARGGHAHFAPMHPIAGIGIYPKTPWFNAVLLKGYLTLYRLEGNPEYVDAMRANLDYAWEHGRGEDGLLTSDWSGAPDDHFPRRHILDQGAMLELYALLARHFDNVRSEKEETQKAEQ